MLRRAFNRVFGPGRRTPQDLLGPCLAGGCRHLQKTRLRRTSTAEERLLGLARPEGFEPPTRCFEGACSLLTRQDA